PSSIHVGRHIPTGRFNKPAPFSAGRSVPIGWTNHAARPFFRPTNLYFDNHFNLFYVSQICDKKNKVLFIDDECLVLTKEFQLPDESQVVLRIPRRHDLYTFNLSDIQPEQHINYLLAKASLEESTKWHRRMAHVNFKTINKLAKNGLVEGLPLKLFTNERNCVAYNKGKQHKASYKAISAAAEMLHQAEIETRRNLVIAAGDLAGSIVSTSGVPAGSVPAGSIPTSSVPASSVPVGGVLAGSVDSAGFDEPAASESVPAVFHPEHADNSTLPPASSVVVDPIATKRVDPSICH
nr:putative ribonuclease H-like domain-containing protein [Tanacetum cinerariifolium]